MDLYGRSLRSVTDLTAAEFLFPGGHVTYLGPGETQRGHKEPVKDTARVFGQAENRRHTIKALMIATLVAAADPPAG